MASTANARRGPTRHDLREGVLEQLRCCPEGLSKAELVARIGDTSAPTMQRVLDDLRDGDAPIRFERHTNKWVLLDRSFRNPLDRPEPEDLLAVLMAQAMLDVVADDELRARIRRLVEQLDEKLRVRARDHKHLATRGIVTGTVTLGTKVDAQVLFAAFRTLRSGVVRILITAHGSTSVPATPSNLGRFVSTTVPCTCVHSVASRTCLARFVLPTSNIFRSFMGKHPGQHPYGIALGQWRPSVWH